jgi:hydroxyethylthiazole kinase-like uncharacterized protein yjeF
VKIVTVSEMRRLEAEADAAGISYQSMMDDAGHAVAEAYNTRFSPNGKRILILAGNGNNGGDGLVAARHLHDAGALVKVYCLQPPDEGDATVASLRQRSIFIADAENDPLRSALQQLAGDADAVVDAVFGTGVRLPLGGRGAQVLGYIKRHLAAQASRSFVLAVDVPSGVDCDTGLVDACTFPADLTVTFGVAKVGQYGFPAADYLGELIVAPIGWPKALPGLQAVQLDLMEPARVRAALPRRPRDAQKYDFGRLVVIAGSQRYVGAAYLTTAAALRSGTGLVIVAAPDPLPGLLAPQLIEATWLPVPGDSGVLTTEASTQVASAANGATAVVLGPGLGPAETTRQFVRDFLKSCGSTPLLVDADGLRLLAQIPDWPKLLTGPTLLTPHLGEMQALTGLSKGEIQKDRLGVARRFAAKWGQFVLLKGAFTVIAAPDGRAVIEPFATPALAKAGSGDVLSGVIGSLMAQGLDPFEAAAAGAYLHGRSGELAAAELGTDVSVIAGDLIKAFPKSLAEMKSQ